MNKRSTRSLDVGTRSGRRRSLLGMAAIAAGVVGLAPGVAGADPLDTESPSIRIQRWAEYQIFTQIQSTTPDADGFFFTTVPRYFEWVAFDNSGVICNNQVFANYAGAEPELLAEGPDLHYWIDTATDYDDQFGGGSFKQVDWEVAAHDCSGNIVFGHVRGTYPRVTQDNNTDGAFPTPDATITYAKKWWVNKLGTPSGGTAHETSIPGASATITVTTEEDERIALVGAIGPHQSRFDLFVDGVALGPVNTWSETWKPRFIWSNIVMTEGTHTIKIVNRPTHGRARLTLDAVLTND